MYFLKSVMCCVVEAFGLKKVGYRELTLKERARKEMEYITTWEKYISDLLGSDIITHAGIYDLKGWTLAKSEDFHVTREEAQKLRYQLENNHCAWENGLTVNRQHYKTRLADGARGIMAKSGLKGVSVCKTRSLIIVGVHREHIPPEECNNVVMSLGDFFYNKAL